MDKDLFIKRKYNEHKHRAKRKQIPFELSWDYYYAQMSENDNWLKYGNGPGYMVWSRTCDVGGYWDGWATLVPWEENQKTRNSNIKNHKSQFRQHSLVIVRWGLGGRGGYPPIIRVDGNEYVGWEAAAKPIGCHPRSLKNYMLGMKKVGKM
jgi:hypothetical protein